MSPTCNATRTAGQDNCGIHASYLRSTPDEVAVISTVRDRAGVAFRVTLRNGREFSVDVAALRWLMRHDLKGIGDDFLPALIALLSRRLFRASGGKKYQRCTFQEWVVGRDYPAALAD